MTTRKQEAFKFFIPAEFEKAKNSAGEEVMKFKGIASTAERDTDGEVLIPEGFDLSYLTTQGFINWNHLGKNNPGAIIGEPTVAKIVDNKLYVEGELYSDSSTARQVWDLANTLSKSSKTRRLGFSIEGKAIEKDPLDDKLIKKAKITGIAITPSPKNPATILDIIKGDITGYEDEFNEVDLFSNGSISEKEFIIDITKSNGERITVDQQYNINIISKSLEAGAISGTDTIDSTDASGAGLKTASVEKKLKKTATKNSNNAEEEEKNIQDKNKFSKFAQLNKADLFISLFEKINDLEKSKQLTENLYQNINKLIMTEANQTNQDELIKALEILGIHNADELVKGKKTEAEEEDETKEVVDTKGEKTPEQPMDEEVVEDAEKKEDKEEESKEDEGGGLESIIDKEKADKKKEEVAASEGKNKVKFHGDEDKEHAKEDLTDDSEIEEDKKEIKKGETDNDLEKSLQDALNEIALLKSQLKEQAKPVEATLESFDTAEIRKSIVDELKAENDSKLDELMKSFGEFKKDMNARIDELANTPAQRKSVTSTYVEKSFSGQNDIEKGNSTDGKTTLSVSRNRQQISNMLLNLSNIEKGDVPVNTLYLNEVSNFESTGTLSKAVISDLGLKNINIVA